MKITHACQPIKMGASKWAKRKANNKWKLSNLLSK
jgi:hypothetical protein